MDKALFLAQLQKNIGMLDDNEQKDILDEYSQHIDMKVAGGMTEAEAIEDFGDFDEFVREILSAYHVKAPFDQDAPSDTTSQASVPTPTDRHGGVLHSGAAALGKAASATKNGARKIARATSGALGKAKTRTMQSVESAKESHRAHQAASNAAGAAPDAARPGDRAGARGARGLGAALRSWLSAAWRVCWNLVKTAVRWMWNALVACCTALCAVMGLASLFLFGACAVLLAQGYPALGLGLAGAGSTLMFGAAAYLLSRLIVRAPKREPEERPLSDGQGAGGSQRGDEYDLRAPSDAEEDRASGIPPRADSAHVAGNDGGDGGDGRTKPLAFSAPHRQRGFSPSPLQRGLSAPCQQRETARCGAAAPSSLFAATPLRPAQFDTMPLTAKGGAWHD